VANQDLSYVELYDLEKDPLEKANLALRQPEQVKALTTQLQAWQASLPAQPTGPVFSATRAN
jgi:hypothetical protein